jgi:hypothetical protein
MSAFRLFRRDPLTLDAIAQAAILVLSPIAVLCVAEGLRWGFVIGLASQPFWIYATARAKQAGMFRSFTWRSGCAESPIIFSGDFDEPPEDPMTRSACRAAGRDPRAFPAGRLDRRPRAELH